MKHNKADRGHASPTDLSVDTEVTGKLTIVS